MRILYILSSTVMGGATHSALTLIKQMAVKGNRVIVVIPNNDDSFEELLININVDFYVVNYCFKAYPMVKSLLDMVKWPFRILKMLITEKKAIRKIAEIIRTEKVDVVHTNVGPIVCGYEASKKMGIPHVWHIREYGDKDFNIKMFPSKFVFRKKLKNSYVISITYGLINYNKLDNCPNAQVIYNGVRKSNDVKLAGKREDYFLCASRVSPAKGFEQIIRVFSVFHEKYPSYKLRIIGLYDKEYVSKLVKLAKDGNSDDAIFFEGYKDNVSDYMAKAMALLVASPCEGFGRMTAEASFAGCIVVGKNTAGTKEIMDITGGFPFISDEEMLNAMISVCNLTEQEYCERAIIAQRRAISNFTEESYVDKVHSLYKSIVLTS